MRLRVALRCLLTAGLVALGLGCGEPAGEDSSNDLPFGVEATRLGADADVQPLLEGPSLMLQGDGAPLDTAFQAHAERVADRPLDVVVLAASFPSDGSSTPECDRLVDLGRVHSCETITIPDPRGADVDRVAETVRRAEVVYFAGGNQCNYVDWAGRVVHTAVIDVFERGGGVGGGSAGLAIQGDVAYDGCTGSVRSDEALADPYDERIHFTDDYFDWPALDRVITDSHFRARDRMGRLITFVARQMKATGANAFFGLGVNEGAALVVDSAGVGTVYGGRAYLVHGGHSPERVEPGTPLTYADVQIVRLPRGTTYDLTERPLDQAYTRSVEAGSLSANPYRPD
ncbi:MAG: cyanophycinase [Salinibacter sp.]|uniref:cyanophycinase n=1 Tax=Salinibacter sp. TaxID=2065818 RepID=UPI0035D4C5B9